MSHIKNEIVSLGNRADQIEKKNNDIEHRNLETNPAKGDNREFKKKWKNSMEIDTIRKGNTKIMGMPERE